MKTFAIVVVLIYAVVMAGLVWAGLQEQYGVKPKVSCSPTVYELHLFCFNPELNVWDRCRMRDGTFYDAQGKAAPLVRAQNF